MPLPEASHPVWRLARHTVICITLATLLTLNYEKFDNRDFGTILSVLAAGLGFDKIKDVVAKTKDSASETPE